MSYPFLNLIVDNYKRNNNRNVVFGRAALRRLPKRRQSHKIGDQANKRRQELPKERVLILRVQKVRGEIGRHQVLQEM